MDCQCCLVVALVLLVLFTLFATFFVPKWGKSGCASVLVLVSGGEGCWWLEATHSFVDIVMMRYMSFSLYTFEA